ncbi:MAG: PASTA domain-containing protein [Fibromonadales bacterium]|nr:PASTA domain-containing protein [Fibromonadales bacterium]
MLFAIVFWVFAVPAIAAVINWVVMPVTAGRLTKTLPVPNVVDLSADEAEAVLKRAGLNAKWAKEGRYSSEIAANNVLIQMPIAGRTVKESRTVFLTLSKGRQEVQIPDLRGVSLRQAEISLQRLELVLGSKIEGAHTAIPRGVVIRTEPEAGSKARIGSRVNIIVSSGNSSGKVLLPNLREMSLGRAMAVIDSLGLTLGNVTNMPSEDKLPNTVLTLNPMPGEYLEPGTTIDLTVAE